MSSRRDFIKTSILGVATLYAAPLIGKSTHSLRYSKIMGANERIRVAAIGVNGRGNAVASTFARQNNCEIAYVCDVDSRALSRCCYDMEKIQGFRPVGAKDFRDILDKKDLDAVMIATPDHWHVPASIWAMQAGKNVYCEKPASYCPREGEKLILAASKYGKIYEIGLQRRSWPNIIYGINAVQNGVIGNVHFGKAWYTNKRASIGKGKATNVPEWLDWNLRQGPAPHTQYKDNYIHYNWHWFWRWGSGEATNNGTHMIDLLRWGMGLDYPTAVNSMGGRYFFDDDQETPDTQVINLEFEGGKFISYEGRSCNPMTNESNSVGVMFYGDRGSILISGSNGYKIYDDSNNLLEKKYSDIPIDQSNTVNPSDKLDALHVNNFLDSIRGLSHVNVDASQGHKSTLLMQLGMISQRVGRELKIDTSNGHIINDDKASAFWSREYEPGYEF